MKRLVGVGPVLALSIAVVVSAVIGLNMSRGPSLIFPGPVNTVSVGLPRAYLGDRWSIGMGSTICLDKPGKVEITSVTPVQSHGLRVIGFALRPNQNWKPTQGVVGAFLGEVRAPLQRFGFTSRTVDVACEHNTPKGYELAVRLLKTVSGPAVASGWMVTYRTSARTGTLAIPYGLLLCPADSADAKRCRSEAT